MEADEPSANQVTTRVAPKCIGAQQPGVHQEYDRANADTEPRIPEEGREALPPETCEEAQRPVKRIARSTSRQARYVATASSRDHAVLHKGSRARAHEADDRSAAQSSRTRSHRASACHRDRRPPSEFGPVTAHADGWGPRGEASEPTPLEQPRDAGAPELQPRGNLGTRPALPAKLVNPGHEAVRGGRRAPPRRQDRSRRPATPSARYRRSHFRTVDSQISRAAAISRALSPRRAAPDDLFSTVWRRPGILVHVHPGLPQCVDLCLATTSFAMGARVGLHNLVVVHS